MRTWWLLKLVVVLTVGCAMQEDKHRAYFHDENKYPAEFSASHLGQDFGDSSVTDLLSPAERQALKGTEWHRVGRDEVGRGDEAFPKLGEEPSSSDKVAGATMTLIGLGITVGAMVAPYFLL